jgi:hypothetical protein
MDIYNPEQDQDILNQFLSPEYSGLIMAEAPDSEENTRADPGSPSWSSDTPHSPDAEMTSGSFGEESADANPGPGLFEQDVNSSSPLYPTAESMIAGMFENVKQFTPEELNNLATAMTALPVEVKSEDPAAMETEPTYGAPTPVFHPDMLSSNDDSMDFSDEEEEPSSKKKRPRKKRKVATSKDESVDLIPEDVTKLTRDQLLALSSRGFEEVCDAAILFSKIY